MVVKLLPFTITEMGTQSKQCKGVAFLVLICASLLTPAISAPPKQQQQQLSQSQLYSRKFAVKPNSPKKVYHKNVDEHKNKVMDRDSNTKNQIQNEDNIKDMVGAPGWQFFVPLIELAYMFMNGQGPQPDQMYNGLASPSEKVDNGLSSLGQGFSWGQVIGYALKLLFVAMGGSNSHDGVDKMDTPASPMQGIVQSLVRALAGGTEGDGESMAKKASEFVNLLMALMNALKTSFSQRALRARSMGQRDRISDFTLASIDMTKAYAKTWNTTEDACKQRYFCEASRECVNDVGDRNALGFCHLTAFAASHLVYYTQQGTKYENTKTYMEAARKGRSQQDCKTLYLCNNEILHY